MVNVRICPHPQLDCQHIAVSFHELVDDALLRVKAGILLQFCAFLELSHDWIHGYAGLTTHITDDFLEEQTVTEAHGLVI